MATVTKGSLKLEEILGAEATDLLTHKSATVPASQLHLPGPDFVDRVWKDSDRPTRVLRSLQSMFGHGRLGNTGYLSILPVDRVSSTPPALRSRPTRSTSTARRSSSWRSRAT